MIARITLFIYFFTAVCQCNSAHSRDLADLYRGEVIESLRVTRLYANSHGKIVGAKFMDTRSGTPISLLQIETMPQLFMWIDTPADSNSGVAHTLEHLLASKGTKGRYASLLKEMALGSSAAATIDDFNFYSLSSATGLDGFVEQFRALLDALFRPDFTDIEAQHESYHFGISFDAATNKRRLVEEGAVYDEMLTGQGIYSYYFALIKDILGPDNPFSFYNSGAPDEMRQVKPSEIRSFYSAHYRLGPTTGLVFALSRKEDIFGFLKKISEELGQFGSSSPHRRAPESSLKAKYPIHSSATTEIKLIPFPGRSVADRARVLFGWKTRKINSQVDLRLLQLFLRVLADGDKSILHKSMIRSETKCLNSGATSVSAVVFLANSPSFPSEFIGLSGIPGKHLTVARIEQLRNRITATIRKISSYPDHSPSLAAFNQLVSSYFRDWRRSQAIWTKSAPQFGLNYETEWKEYLEYLEMDPAFIRSISDEPVWEALKKQLRSGKNIWNGLIRKSHLLDVPYATASVPSPTLLEKMDEARQNRIATKTKELMERFHTDDEQEALTMFEREENIKTKEIDEIASRVPRPRFTDKPPLTADDDIRYSQFPVEGVPVVASFFDRAPTMDLGLSFDLRRIPQKYYKYLSIIPRYLESMGTRAAKLRASMQRDEQKEIGDFSVRYDFNPASRRADLRMQVSSLTLPEFEQSLAMIQRMTSRDFLDQSNASVLRDIVEKRVAEDEAFTRGENEHWFVNPADAFRYQDDPLYVALSSAFTQAHWDSRLKWLLHKPVSEEDVGQLAVFTDKILTTSGALSAKEMSQKLSQLNASGLDAELIEYWQKNISAFDPAEWPAGLRGLALEVQEDLKTGPRKTITDLAEFVQVAFNRRALNVDLTLDGVNLEKIRPVLSRFLESIPERSYSEIQERPETSHEYLFFRNLKKRYPSSATQFPWFVGLEDPGNSTANMMFYGKFPGYSQLDHDSLIKVLAGNLLSGSGPHSLFMKAGEDGLAYGSSITTSPNLGLIRYYAERSPDIASLIELANSTAATIPQLRDPFLVDYSLQRTFPVPRSMSTFAERGRGIANDIRDGNDPERIRKFSQKILKLRTEPNLLSEITAAATDSIAPVLVNPAFLQQQQRARSLFFFVAPEKELAEAEKRLSMPVLLRLYPSDFWLDF